MLACGSTRAAGRDPCEPISPFTGAA
jgi:hypothetical protein